MISLYTPKYLGLTLPQFSEILQYFNSLGFKGATSKQIKRESDLPASKSPKGFTVL